MDLELYVIYFILFQRCAFKIGTHAQEAKCLKNY